MKKRMSFICGFLIGSFLFGGSIAYAAGILAEHSSHRVYVDGNEIELEAYVIEGNNYVKLRDVGEAVGFNVWWNEENRSVQIQSDQPYTGEKPAEDIPTAIVRLLNDYRAEHELKEVTVSEVLTNAAQDYAATKPQAHDLSLSCSLRAQYGCEHGVGENISWGGARATAEDIFQGWVNSPPHQKALLYQDADTVGIGYYTEQGAYYCVLLIGDCGLESEFFGNGHK